LVRHARETLLDTGDGSLVYEDGELRERDTFEIVARAFDAARHLREDISVATFVERLPPEEQRFARMMVQGFDAADPARASARAIAAEWHDTENGQTSRSFRPRGGYGNLLRALRAQLDARYVRLLLETPVRGVRRTSEGVLVEATGIDGDPLVVRARAAIITLPVGVLRGDAVRFEPPLPASTRRALDHLVMGPVVKLVLRFCRPFWEELEGHRYRDVAFFQLPGAPFPVYWTLLPQRAPLVVAWAGGPNADALAELDERRRLALALDGLRTLFGVEPRNELEAVYCHDWQRDPFSRGAYSYVAVGGADAASALAAPVDGVLFFAGEATSTNGEAGTVAGALETGERAAREALAALP
jgi:monoamine oxidase